MNVSQSNAAVTAAEREPIVADDTNVFVKDGSEKSTTDTHPWRRLFARIVDLVTVGMLVFMLVSFLFGFSLPQYVPAFIEALENPVIGSVAVYLVWLPTEAFFLAATGTTPAKWVFGITVVSKDGKRLSFASALKRSALVWIQGEGLGIPFVTLVTRLFAYSRLTRSGTTLWDSSVGSVVTHKKWGPIRGTASVLAVVAAFAILITLNDLG